MKIQYRLQKLPDTSMAEPFKMAAIIIPSSRGGFLILFQRLV